MTEQEKPDPRDPDYSRKDTFFQYHNCYYCNNGEKPCPFRENPANCEYPHARND